MIYFESKKLYFYLKTIILEDLIMKTFSQFRNKLTAKQANNYALVSSSVLATIVAILIALFLWSSFAARGIIISILMSIMAFIGFYLFFAYFIFKGHDKHWAEKHENAKQRVITKFNLNTKTRTKVRYNFEKMLEDTSDKEMLVRLLKIPEYKFFLRLTEGDTVELIVTDKDNYIISIDNFTNFIYVDTYFEKID